MSVAVSGMMWTGTEKMSAELRIDVRNSHTNGKTVKATVTISAK